MRPAARQRSVAVTSLPYTMTSLPYIEPLCPACSAATLRVSDTRETNDTRSLRKSFEKATNTAMRSTEPNANVARATSHKILDYGTVSDLPPLPSFGKRRPTEGSPLPKLGGVHLERAQSLELELEARRKLNTLRKTLSRAETESALHAQLKQRQRNVRRLKADIEELSGVKLRKHFARRMDPAPPEEQLELGIILCESFSMIEPDPRARGWYKLFRFSECSARAPRPPSIRTR